MGAGGKIPHGICFLVRAFSGGGAQRDAILLANGIADTGVAATIMVLDAQGPLRSLVAPAVGIVDLGRGRKLKMALALPAILSALSKTRPAVLVASEASGNALAVIATRLLPRSRRPRLVLREVASPMQARTNDPYVQNRLAYRLAPWLYPRADLVVALTEPVRGDLVKHFRVPRQRAVALGTNAVLTQSREQVLAATTRAVEPGLLVAVGRLSQEKGFATLLEAVALVRKRRPVRLVIVGEGPDRAGLEAQIKALHLDTTVELAGFHSDPGVFLERAQLFVSSSRYEGLGNAIIEALSHGVPVVSTDAPYGPREILQDGRWGDLVPVDDAAALADAIEARLAHAADDGRNGKERAADFTVENAAATFLDILKDFGVKRLPGNVGAI
ncbi:MAG: glycosyltransferase [Mesorhizobium sp.]|nr:glycosyltransferase [Mesorhizobium sp.]MBN9245631.1 glycosyltransferase [Mesorhizobium sp.]